MTLVIISPYVHCANVMYKSSVNESSNKYIRHIIDENINALKIGLGIRGIQLPLQP